MKKIVIKDSIKTILKKLGSIMVIVTALSLGYLIGVNGASQKEDVGEVTPHNSYAHAFSSDEISIAVNESNELILIDRQTGEYNVYSDTIGSTIFEMYANRIYAKATNND